jgi:hypothetical protein
MSIPPRPTVRVTKPPRDRGVQGPIEVYIEGRGGQRVHIHVSPFQQTLVLSIQHDDRTELEVYRLDRVPWYE